MQSATKQSTGLPLPNRRFGADPRGSNPSLSNALLCEKHKEQQPATKQSTGLFLPNQRFGADPRGSNPSLSNALLREKHKEQQPATKQSTGLFLPNQRFGAACQGFESLRSKKIPGLKPWYFLVETDQPNPNPESPRLPLV